MKSPRQLLSINLNGYSFRVYLSMAVLSENRSDMFAQKLFHTTAELQGLKYLWNHEKMFETGDSWSC